MAKSSSFKWKTFPTTTTSSSSLPLLTHPCSVTVTIYPEKPQPWLSSTPTNPFSSFFSQYQHPFFCQLRRRTPIAAARYRRRDSFARAFRNRKRFNFSSGDNDNEDDYDVDDDDDDFGRKRRRRKRPWWSDSPPASETDQGPGIVEEFIDSLWIFKVFGSYGWMLPVIILSLLLSTGPKAFLMALALPIGQSALTLAFKKVQDKLRSKGKTKKKRRVSTAGNFELEEEEEEESQGTRKTVRVDQSWIPKDDVSVNKDSQDTSNFGGWNELDKTMEFDMGSLKRSVQTARSGQTHREKGKFSKRERKGDVPLLLRLLIAVFPFLSSWTKML